MDQYVDFWAAPEANLTLAAMPEDPGVEGMLQDDDLVPDGFETGFEGQTLVSSNGFEDHNTLAPEGATVADDEDIMAAAEAIDSEHWYFAAIITGVPRWGSGSDLEPLERYSYLGMAFDEVDGEHITRIILVHEEPERAEANAESFEQNLADEAYDFIEFRNADTDGRILTVEVQNDVDRQSLWHMAVTSYDPLFGYEEN